jgi:NADH-quinone oxidoreductase E subunit
MSVEFSQEGKKKLAEILARYPEKRPAMLPVLYLAAEEFGYVGSEAEEYVAEILEVPVVKVREVLSFYTLIPTRPLGRHHIQVCRNIACYLRGHESILEHIKAKLGIDVGETTEDGRFTLSEVECLGACEIAPMMQVDKDYYGNLTPEVVDKLLEELD